MEAIRSSTTTNDRDCTHHVGILLVFSTVLSAVFCRHWNPRQMCILHDYFIVLSLERMKCPTQSCVWHVRRSQLDRSKFPNGDTTV